MAFEGPFGKQPEAAIASYNYTDIAEGTGVVQFMGAKVAASGAIYYRLTTNSGLNSDDPGYETSNGFDEDFDVTFNRPQTIKGDLILSVPLSYAAQSDTTHSGYITATIKHVDKDSNETTIGEEVTSPSYSFNLTGWQPFFSTLIFPVEKTHFKAGETLRINITASDSGGTGGNGVIGFSPSGTIRPTDTRFDGGTARLSAFVPFVIQL